jgi:hypothetical protein
MFERGISLHQENKFFKLDLPRIVFYTFVMIEVLALINLQLNLLFLRHPNKAALTGTT